MSEKLTEEEKRLISSELSKMSELESFDIIDEYIILWVQGNMRKMVHLESSSGELQEVPSAIEKVTQIIRIIDDRTGIDVTRLKMAVVDEANAFLDIREKIKSGNVLGS